jgi:ABC-type transporter Mla MlaB component
MAAVKQISEQLIGLEGELKFPVIMQTRRQLEKLLASGSGLVEVDFAKVTGVDSSSLSFWFCCLRYVSDKDCELRALNLPVEMQGIADLVGLQQQFS